MAIYWESTSEKARHLGGWNANNRKPSALTIKGICGCGRPFYQDFSPDCYYDSDAKTIITACSSCNYPHLEELAKRIKAL